MINVFAVVLAISIFISGCRTNKTTDLKDEGLFIAEKRSLSDVVARMSKEYHWDQKTSDTALATLRNVIPATFQINCGQGGSGSGVFIGANGEFVTAAHVLSQTRRCNIKTMRIAHDDTIEVKYSVQIVIVEKTKKTLGTFDISQGRFYEFSSPGFVSVLDEPKFPIDQKLFSLGFPGETSRNGSINIVKKDNEDDKTIREGLFNVFCGDAWLAELERRSTLLKETSEGFYKTNIQACSLAKEEFANRKVVSYDAISKNEPLSIGFGRLAFFDANIGIATVDSFHGMSGGPVVALDSGILTGLVARGMIPNHHDPFIQKHDLTPTTDIDEIFYAGVDITQIISKSRLNSLPSPTLNLPDSWSVQDLQHCAESFSPEKEPFEVFKIEEKDGFVDFVTLEHGHAYTLKIPSAVPNLPVVYQIFNPTGSNRFMKFEWDSEKFETFSESAQGLSKYSGLPATTASSKTKPVVLNSLQKQGVSSTVDTYFELIMKYTKYFLESQKIDVTDPKRREKIFEYLAKQDINIQAAIPACLPFQTEVQRDLLKTMFGI